MHTEKIAATKNRITAYGKLGGSGPRIAVVTTGRNDRGVQAESRKRAHENDNSKAGKQNFLCSITVIPQK